MRGQPWAHGQQQPRHVALWAQQPRHASERSSSSKALNAAPGRDSAHGSGLPAESAKLTSTAFDGATSRSASAFTVSSRPPIASCTLQSKSETGACPAPLSRGLGASACGLTPARFMGRKLYGRWYETVLRSNLKRVRCNEGARRFHKCHSSGRSVQNSPTPSQPSEGPNCMPPAARTGMLPTADSISAFSGLREAHGGSQLNWPSAWWPALPSSRSFTTGRPVRPFQTLI